MGKYAMVAPVAGTVKVSLPLLSGLNQPVLPVIAESFMVLPSALISLNTVPPMTAPFSASALDMWMAVTPFFILALEGAVEIFVSETVTLTSAALV